jgi:hypothetical protein
MRKILACLLILALISSPIQAVGEDCSSDLTACAQGEFCDTAATPTANVCAACTSG